MLRADLPDFSTNQKDKSVPTSENYPLFQEELPLCLLLTWTSLNSCELSLGIMPSGVCPPIMVCVFPLPVCPYANIVAGAFGDERSTQRNVYGGLFYLTDILIFFFV